MGEAHHGPEARYLWQVYPKTKREIEDSLGLQLLSKPLVLLIKDQYTFERLSGNPYIAGFAVPWESVIVLHISPISSSSAMLHDTFKHELCHLLLHDHIKGQPIPKWLNEGICQWVSGTLGEVMAGDAAAIGRIDTAHRFIPLEQLTSAFPGDRNQLILAYRESYDFISFVAARHGGVSLRRILAHLKDGDGVDAAFSKALSKSFRDVQEEWRSGLGDTNRWLVWASRSLDEILFFTAALLTILAGVCLKFRRRSLEAAEDRTGHPSPSRPSRPALGIPDARGRGIQTFRRRPPRPKQVARRPWRQKPK